MTTFSFDGIGTQWYINIPKALSSKESSLLKSLILDRISSFDKTYSRFRSDSLVSHIAEKAGTYTLPDDAQKLMSVYKDIYLRTNGLVTPLVGNVISDAGYDASYTLIEKKELRTPKRWEQVIEYIHPNLVIHEPVILDFGAGGKGYLIDIIASIIESAGVREYTIDAGGDILHKGEEVINIGLENPNNTNQVIGIYPLGNGSICGSAGNRRAWGRFTHIINPKTLTSPTLISAVWVVADNAFIADIIATCLFFVPPAKLSDIYSFEYVILRADLSIETSTKFNGQIFK